MSAEVEYERTRDRARAFLAAIDELTTYKEQVGAASGALESGEDQTGGAAAAQEKKEEDVELMNSLQIAIERLNVKFRETAGELSHRANDLMTQETKRNHLRQQANLYSTQQTIAPSQELKEQIEGEYFESKLQGQAGQADHSARTVGKGMNLNKTKKKRISPKKMKKLKTKQELTQEEANKLISDFSKLSTSELDKGIMNMIIRGNLHPDVDLGKAFDSDFFTTIGINPVKYVEGKTPKEMLQLYISGLVSEKQAVGQELRDVAAGAKKKKVVQMEKERALNKDGVVKKQKYSMKVLDANKLIYGRSQSLTGEQANGAEKEEAVLNEEDKFFKAHRTFKKAYQMSMRTLGDGFLPILQYKFLKTMPDFRLFKAKNSLNWKKIEAFFPRLTDFCQEHSIFLGAVPIRKMVIYAMRSQAASEYELDGLVVNLYELFKDLNNESSATKIQAAYKGYMVRKKHPRKEIMKSIFRIQAYMRKKALRKRFEAVLLEKRLKKEREVRKLQGDLQKNWKHWCHTTRTIIHIPSLSLCQEQRITSEHFLTRQFSQLARLCDLRNPQVSLIYISPLNIPQDLLGYFLSIMHVRGVKDPKLRLKVIVPENLHRLPGHLSLTQALLASPTALKRLEIAVNGQRSYILPDRVTVHEQELSVSLKVPILGPLVDACTMFSTKSGARALFKEADMNVAPGAAINISAPTTAVTTSKIEKDLSNAKREIAVKLVSLVKENPFVRKWVFKINNEYESRGHAMVDLKKVKPLTDVAARVENLISVSEEDKVDQVTDELMELLPEHAVIHNKDVYPTWDNFARQMGSVGGVIEAYPEWVVGSPSVNVFIDPLGNAAVQSTHEQIFTNDFTFVGASFPQSSVPHLPLEQAALAIAKKCYDKGVIGYFGVDFVALRQEGFLRLWAVDLNLHMTKTQLTFQFFDFLAGGSFNPQSGIYSMPYGISYENKSGDHPQSCLSDSSQTQGSRRCYVMTDFVSSSRFEGLQLKTFFKDCRNLGLTYDIGECTGTAFNVIDTLSAGVLSIFSTGFTMVDAMKEASRTLSILAKKFGQTVSRGGTNNDSESFHRIYSTLRFISDKLRYPARTGIHG